MKKLLILISICCLPILMFGQVGAENFAFFFIYPAGAGFDDDGSSVTFTFTNKTRGCTLTEAIVQTGDGMHEGAFTQTTGAAFFNACQQAAYTLDEIEFIATVVKGPHTGKVMKWSGIIDFAEDGTSDVTVQLEFEVPTPTISVTPPAAFCAGKAGEKVTVTFTNAPADIATGGYTIDWGIAGITTYGALSTTEATGEIDPAVLKSTVSGKAVLKKGDTELATSAAYTVNINPKPKLTLPKDPAVCEGASMNLTATLNPTGTKFEWEKDGTPTGNGSGTCSTGNLDNPATFTVIGESAAGCKSAPETVTVTTKPIPTVSLDAEKTDACSGEEQKLTATASAADKYIWSPVSGSASEVKVTPTATTEYSVIAEKDGCQSTEAKVTVTVHTVSVTLTAAPPSVVSGGVSVLTAKPTLSPAGNTVKNYNWTGNIDGATSGATLNEVTSKALTVDTPFEVEVEDNMGCKGKSEIKTVTISGSALVVDPKDVTVCSESLPKTLNAGISGGTGALDIEWTVPAGLNLSGNKLENPQVLNTSTPGTYNVSVKVTKGSETQTGTLTLVINETPKLGTVSANPSSSFAVGGSAQLTLSNVTPTGTPLTWSGGPLEATTGLSVSTGVINTVGSYTYTVTADNATCTAKKTVTVTVTGTTPTPDLVINTPTVPPSGSTNTPIEGSVTVSGGDGDYTYDWSCPDPTVNIVDKGNGNVEITSSTAGPKEVCVEVTDGNGDTDKKCFNVIVTDPSSVNLVMSVDKKCAYPGEFLTLTITGSGADSYSFVLRDKSNNPVLTVTDNTSWETYKVYTTAEGTYKITDFKYKIGGVESNGTAPAPIEATFNIVPNVYAQEEHLQTINNCQGEQLTLKGTGDPGLQYTWDRGVTDGVPFIPATTGTYTVTGTNPATGCKNTSTVNVTVNQKPTVTAPAPQEICLGELVTLTASVSTDVVQQPTWNNGVINGQPFKPTITATYEVIAENTAGCTATATTTVTVNQPPHIVRTSRNPRNIAIGKDVYFALTAEGKNLTYQWKKKENGIWVDLADVTNNTPKVIGSKTDSLSLLTVPQSWDGSEFRCVVTGDCGKDSTEFQLGVRECFEIKAELVMYEGIIPDEQPGNNIDGWYCRGQRIALKAIITSDEGYDIEGAHYKWTIDGLDIPEEHIEIESDTAVLTWIPRFTEDDIVVKVCAYSDGACEEVCPKYIRLKARDFENVAMRIMTDRDPSHMFCAGDTVNFWLATKNAGLAPKYTWYNDVFELPDEQSPKNELIHYESEKITMVMGQEDTWMRVVMNPSAEICIKEPVVVDTVFMKKKPWVEPFLDIDCADTLVCRGDTVTMQAIYANAGENPTFQWQRSIGDPIDDWNLGTKTYAVAHIDEQDVWVKCTMVPSEDVCYDASKPIVDAIKINVMEDNASVTIACDMEDKQSGDELIFEAEVKNILGEPRYEWYVNEMKAPVTESEYITNTLKQGDIVYCLASGERVCQTRVQSNLIVVNYGQFNRDTMLVIYKNESIKDLDMVKEGDNLATVIFKIETSARNGVASISPDGKFSYLPNAGFVGTDDVKYVIINRSDKSVIAEGYIYITVKENDRFFVPNLITPNDDGLNDTWKLDFLSQYPNHIIQVFNRDGIMVYEARNYQNDWKGEGMTKGGYVGHINLVNGIYTYVIDLGDKDKTVLKSWLEIRANLNRRNYR